jgi:hypothetical protein
MKIFGSEGLVYTQPNYQIHSNKTEMLIQSHQRAEEEKEKS